MSNNQLQIPENIIFETVGRLHLETVMLKNTINIYATELNKLKSKEEDKKEE